MTCREPALLMRTVLTVVVAWREVSQEWVCLLENRAQGQTVPQVQT